MNFSKSFPDELRSQISISDVVAKRVVLKRKGKEYSGLCPFHNEKSPSFTVNDQKGFYHCFGCGAHGDIIGFVMQSDGFGFKDAVVKLANDYGIKIPLVVSTQEDRKQQDKITQDYFLLENICQFFENNLFASQGSEALKYLYQRGLNNSDIKKFRLGFAPDNADLLLQHLKSSKERGTSGAAPRGDHQPESFSDADLLDCGVIGKNDNGKLYNKFRRRIIFPITDSGGKIIAFGGRILGEGQPKYLNSSETRIFKKGHNLYNFANARKSIYDEKFAVIVEGYMDAISLSCSGIENVVAPLGTALTLDQLQIILKSTDDVVVCLDGDLAGIKAMKRTIDLVLPGLNPKNLIRFAILPNGVDPDDFVRKEGRVATKNFLTNAQNLSKVLFDFESQDLHLDYSSDGLISPEKKAQLEAKLFAKVNLIADLNSRKHFFQYYKNLLFELGQSKTTRKNFHKNNNNLISKLTVSSSSDFDKQTSYSIAIIAIIINFPELKDYQDEFCILKNLEFKNQELSDIKEHLINFLDKNSWQNKNADGNVGANFLEIKTELEKIITNEVLKNKIFSMKFFDQNLDNIKHKLQIFLLQYFYEEVSGQYAQTLALNDEIETDEKVLKDGKQKELFNYKTVLEKKILQLESDAM